VINLRDPTFHPYRRPFSGTSEALPCPSVDLADSTSEGNPRGLF
jgi:hypothetical protein